MLGGGGSDWGGGGSDLRDAKANGARYIGATLSPSPVPRQL